jgi:hypothetical protein
VITYILTCDGCGSLLIEIAAEVSIPRRAKCDAPHPSTVLVIKKNCSELSFSHTGSDSFFKKKISQKLVNY